MEKACHLCGDTFLGSPTAKYCGAVKALSCEVCGSFYSRSCDAHLAQTKRRTCSRPCAGKAALSTLKSQASVALCVGCGESFLKAQKRALFCGEVRLFPCEVCGEDFQTSCESKLRKLCQTHRRALVIACTSCGGDFLSIQGQKVCRKPERRLCSHCGQVFRASCGVGRKVCGAACSKAWAIKTRRATLARQAALRSCARCGDFFRATGQRLFCRKQKSYSCGVCEEDFLQLCEKSLKTVCSPLCRALSYSKGVSPGTARRLHSLAEWADDFLKEHGRRPQRADFTREFKVSLADKYLIPHVVLKSRKGYWLEHYVLSFLAEDFPELEVVERSRKLVDGSPRKRLELDILLPELLLGFEVQDFISHSRTSDMEPNPWKGLKKGPTYHEHKRQLAQEQLGVQLIDLWEDQILDGSFKVTVSHEIASRLLSK